MNAILEYILMLVYWIVSFIFFLMIFRKEQFLNAMYTIFFTAVPNDITDINDPNYTGGVNYIFTPFKLFY